MGRNRSLDKEGFRGPRRSVRGALVLVAAVVVGAAILIPGGSATPSNSFSAVFTSSAPLEGGDAGTIHLIITNVSSGPKLDSATITAPSGFTITSGSLTLSHLGLAQGTSYSTDIGVATACTPKTYTWGITATNRNGDILADAGGNRDVVVSDTLCKYEFVQQRQPKDAGVDTIVTSAPFNDRGQPVAVVLRNPATGNVDATATADVSLTASTGSFTGTGPTPLDSGQAEFGSLRSPQTPAQFVSLRATGSPFQPSDPSNLFNILAQVQKCDRTTSTTCKITSPQASTTVDANASGFVSGDTLAATVYDSGVVPPPTNCGSPGPITWTPLSGASGVQVEYAPVQNSDGWTITIKITIDKSLIVNPSKGAAQYDVCLGAKKVSQVSCTDALNAGFKTKSGATATCVPSTGLYWGLLADCLNGNKKPNPDPCVQSKTKDNAGDLILTAVKKNPWDGNFHT
jgi:hypothetical protein